MPRNGSIRAVWLDAERIEQHVHVKVHTGKQYGQDEIASERPGGAGIRNDAGVAGTLILRLDQWPSFIRALAVGGHATGLRVCWCEHTEDQRNLWNGTPDAPCILGTTEPVEWEPNASFLLWRGRRVLGWAFGSPADSRFE